MDDILELREVSKRYANQKAVDGVSLVVPRGAFFSLLGPSGCGKTTTLRLIAGFEEPTGGEIWLDGRPINHLKPYQRNVSTVFQNYALFPHLSVAGNLEFGLRRRRAREIDGPVRRMIEMLQLAGKENRMPHQISGGERQRVALARSLVLAPDVLLLDEPLSALDPDLRKQVRAELKNIQRRVGITFLFVTHDQEEALALSDEIAVMHSGRVEQTGSPQDLYLNPKTRFVASFLGRMNWISGAGVRPEAVRLVRQAEEHSRPATVVNTVFLGNCIHVEALLNSGETVVAEVNRLEAAFGAGDRIHAAWRPCDELHFPAAP